MDLDMLDMILESYPELETNLGYDSECCGFLGKNNHAILGVCDNFMDAALIYSEGMLGSDTSDDSVCGYILRHETETVSVAYMKELSELYPDMLYADGFDDCIIGVVIGARGDASANLVYSISKCIECIAKNMSLDNKEDESQSPQEEFDDFDYLCNRAFYI